MTPREKDALYILGFLVAICVASLIYAIVRS